MVKIANIRTIYYILLKDKKIDKKNKNNFSKK